MLLLVAFQAIQNLLIQVKYSIVRHTWEVVLLTNRATILSAHVYFSSVFCNSNVSMDQINFIKFQTVSIFPLLNIVSELKNQVLTILLRQEETLKQIYMQTVTQAPSRPNPLPIPDNINLPPQIPLNCIDNISQLNNFLLNEENSKAFV